jgi:transposase
VITEVRGHRPKVSMAGMLAYHPATGAARLLVDFHRGNYDSELLTRVLRGLHAELDSPITLIWDNLSAHTSAAMRDFVAEQPWLETVQLPSYAPDLNPVEDMWSCLKGRDLAGHACRNVDELLLAAQVSVIRIRREPELLWGFLRHTGLPLNDFTQLPKDQ